MVLMAVLWLAFLVGGMGLFVAYTMTTISITSTQAFVSYADSTGISYGIIAIIAGSIIYYAVKHYRMSHGVDMELLYKTIPPE